MGVQTVGRKTKRKAPVMIVFVSGHLDVTPEEFAQHYAPGLQQHVLAGNTFVVGDARGADRLAHDFLNQLGADVTVFHMKDKPRLRDQLQNTGGVSQRRGARRRHDCFFGYGFGVGAPRSREVRHGTQPGQTQDFLKGASCPRENARVKPQGTNSRVLPGPFFVCRPFCFSHGSHENADR